MSQMKVVYCCVCGKRSDRGMIQRCRACSGSSKSTCACGNPDGTNVECERCRLIAEIAKLRESLADHYQCDVCKKWRHVEDMLRPHGNSEDLCCDEGCCEAWNDRQDRS